jgi:23S rRNA-/tRNA-specific pseudouridylate synthase
MVRVVPTETVGARAPRETTAEVYATTARVDSREGGRASLSVEIRKGFRHQVRAHLAYLGFPIYGDPLYGVPVPQGAPVRMYLHASAISLRHPLTGAPLRIQSAAPEEFRALLSLR